MSNKYVAKYEEIASEVATAIVNGDYKVGDKLHGRSVLASQFKVSPETIRKAVSLLQNQAVVATMPGSGSIILSRDAARKFLDHFFDTDIIEKTQRRLQELIEQRNALNKEIDDLIVAISEQQEKVFLRKYNLHEIQVEAGASLDGQSVQSAQIHSLTGATVVAIKRDDQCIYAPGRSAEFQQGDVIVFAGNKEVQQQLAVMASGPMTTDNEA